MDIPMPTRATPGQVKELRKLLAPLARAPLGATKTIARYEQAIAHPLLVPAVRDALGQLTPSQVGHANRYDLPWLHFVGILALDASPESKELLGRLVEATLAELGESPMHALGILGAHRRVLKSVPGPVAQALCARVTAPWRDLFPRTALAPLFDSIGVVLSPDVDATFSLTHVAEGGWAQLVGSSAGDVRVVFATTDPRCEEVLVEAGELQTPASLPPLEDIRDVRAHLERCVAAKGMPPWSWGQLQDPARGPFGSIVRAFGFDRRAKEALEAWWLGGAPVGGRPVKPVPPPSRYEAYVPTGVSSEDVKRLRTVFRTFVTRVEGCESWPARKAYERLRELANDPLLVRTFVAWSKDNPSVRDWGMAHVLGVLMAEGSADALCEVDRVIADVLAGGDMTELWVYVQLVAHCRPEHPRRPELERAWRELFDASPGGRLLESIGVRPPTDEHWEVILMARQERGETIVEVYPGGFYRASASAYSTPSGAYSTPGSYADTRDFGESPETLLEQYDAFAREHRLEPWNRAAVWKPLEVPNGSIVQVNGFPAADREKIASWFRDRDLTRRSR